MNTIFALVTIAGLVIIIFLGFTFEASESVDYFDAPNGMTGIILAFVLIFFAFIGFEDMANVAEEVKRPKKNTTTSNNFIDSNYSSNLHSCFFIFSTRLKLGRIGSISCTFS